MTLNDAIEIRTRQLQGHAVNEYLLAEAIRVIQETATPTPRAPNKGLQPGKSAAMRAARVRVVEQRLEDVQVADFYLKDDE